MIILENTNSRRFIGSLDKDVDIIEGLREFCTENEVITAWFNGTGLFKNLKLKRVNTKGMEENPTELDGVWFASNINGNLSTLNERPEIRLYGQFTNENGEMIQGIIQSGVVDFFEFIAWTVDDYLLQRDDSEGSYDRWAYISPYNQKEVMKFQITPKNRHARPMNESSEDELTELMIDEMRRGDRIQHPSLGLCTVIDTPKEERIMVQLPNGKRVSLATKVLRVEPYKEVDGIRVFPVHIKRHK